MESPKPKLAAQVLWYLGVVSMYDNGAGWAPLFRWWNPLFWFLFVIFLVPCAFAEDSITTILPVALDSFYEQRKSQLRWWRPWL